MALHVGDELVLRDIADDSAEIRRANSLSKEKTEISVAEHVRSDFVGAIEPSVVRRVENQPSDLLDRKAAALAIMKNSSGSVRSPVRSSDDHIQRFLQGDGARGFAA